MLSINCKDYIFRYGSVVPTNILKRDLREKIKADTIEQLEHYREFFIYYDDFIKNFQVINMTTEMIVESKFLKGKRVFRIPILRTKYSMELDKIYVEFCESCLTFSQLNEEIHQDVSEREIPSWNNEEDLMYKNIQEDENE